MKRIVSAGALACFFFAAAMVDRSFASIPRPLPGGKPMATGNPSRLHVDFGSIPLYFTANRGQVDAKALFYAKASRYTLWLTERGLVFDSFQSENPKVDTGKELSLRHDKIGDLKYKRDVSRLIFLNAAKHPEIVAVDETELKVNYFIGNDSKKWHTAVPTSGAVLYKNIYKNIDLKVYGSESRIEYDWIVRPGGDPRHIRFQYENVKGTRVDGEGNLLVKTGFGELLHKQPVAYQEPEKRLALNGQSRNGTRMAVESRFKQVGKNAYGFEVGAYDAGLDLVIDPVVLAYSTYLGGSIDDYGYAIAVDGSGNAYVTGVTQSTNFPILNQYQTNQPSVDMFVTKIDTTKIGIASLVYSTYLGGIGSIEKGYAIATDSSGCAYVAGFTDSPDFPLLNQYQAYQGYGDAFLTKIDTTRSGSASLVYSTCLGGNNHAEYIYGIAVDGSGNAYVTGYVAGPNFPTLNQYQTFQAGYDAFVTKIDTTKSGIASLIYSTYLGGNSSEFGQGIAVDNSGKVYVTGSTDSTNFPTLNPYQQTCQGYRDVFVTKLDTTESGNASLLYSTYLGGGTYDDGYAIAVDNSGNAYVTGITIGTDFPTLNQYQTDQVGQDAFVTKIDTTQSGTASLVYSTYLGGNSNDQSWGIAVDSRGKAYVTGYTLSTDFPTLNQYQVLTTGTWEIFVTKIDPTQSGHASLVYSTYLGGFGDDLGKGIAVDNSGNAYVTGYTVSAIFPTQNQYQAYQGGYDAFIAKISFNAEIAVTKTSDNPAPHVGENFNFTVTVTNNGPCEATGLQVTDPLPAGLAYVSSTASTGTYTLASGVWDIGTLANGATASLSIVVQGTGSGSVTNTASVTALDQNDPVVANDSASASVTLIQTYTLTIAAGTGGTTNPAPGTYTYDEGTAVSIQATASVGYRFESWSGDASGTNNPVSITMDGNKTVTANFIRQFALTNAAGPGGTTDPVPGTYMYDEGTVVSVTATASAGYRFGSWSGDASGTNSPVSITMNGNKTVTANFIRQFTLTIISGAGGTTNPRPGAYAFDQGTSVALRATAATGFSFGSWSGDASGSANPITITMNANKKISANFIRGYTLTITTGAGGTTNPVPGTYSYYNGTPVGVQALPAAAYEFTAWSGDASGSANPVSVSMNRDKAIQANFSRVVKAPLGLTAEKRVNRNVSMIESIVRLRWQPNSANAGTISYRIYRIENGQATAIANVGEGAYEYIVNGLQADKAYLFGVTAVNSQGWESDMVRIAVQ